VKVLDSTTLELLHESGERVRDVTMEASMGELVVSFPGSFFYSGLFGRRLYNMPCFLLGSILLLVLSFRMADPTADPNRSEEALPTEMDSVASVVWGSTAASVVLATLWLASARRFYSEASPLHVRLQKFKQEVAGEHSPVPCDRGPDRAVSFLQLRQFRSCFQSFILDRNMYYVVSNMIIPLTEKSKLSYAELVGPRKIDWFVSHFWGDSFQVLVHSLKKTCNCCGNVPRVACAN